MAHMSKNEFRKYAQIRGCEAVYSGKRNRFFLKKLVPMNIHAIINDREKSNMDCEHWYRTTLAGIADIGDYMQKHELTERQRAMWGKQLSEKARLLIANYSKMNK